MRVKHIAMAIAAIGLAAPAASFATDGYFSHGYGMKAKGMAGVSTARAVDTFGGANNPGSMAFVGNRLDVGVDLFMPIREAQRTGSVAGLNAKSESDSDYFLIPEFGYNRMLNDNLALGITVYGNGGMNTDYPGGEIQGSNPVCNGFLGAGGYAASTNHNLLCGTGDLGVDLMQLVIAPTLAYKLTPNHAIGVAPLIGYQRFEARGIQSFDNFLFSNSIGNVTNRGHDDAWGYGVRIGWMGKVTERLSLGAAWSSKISMDEFSDYRGLFAENGGFDMPENFNAGFALKLSDAWTLAADYKWIGYSDVRSVSNPMTGPLGGVLLGTPGGRGFGWDDVNVFKVGLEWQYNPQWTFRAGYGHTDNPIQARDVTFNILAPGVVQDHVTLGMTYTFASGNELTLAYMHAFENDVQGGSLFNSLVGPGVGGTERIQMYQNSIGIAFGMKM